MANKQVDEQLLDTIIVPLEVPYVDKAGNEHTEVELRDIQGIDEEAISKSEIRSNIGRVITTLLASTAVRVGDLTLKQLGKAKWEKIFQELKMGDRDNLMLELYKFAKGNEMALDMKCPHCSGKIKHIVDAEFDIEKKPLEADANNISFELPRGFKNDEGEICKTGSLRLPEGTDQELLDAVARKNPGQANTNLLTRIVKELQGVSSVNSAVLRKMSTRDRDYLLKQVTENSYGPKYVVEFPCPHCSEDVEAGVHPINFL